MRLLFDTHLVLDALAGREFRLPGLSRLVTEGGAQSFVSVASLWEIAIKSRLGKLDLAIELADIAGFLQAAGFVLLPISAEHVTASASPQPSTRDPFDRLLLGVCDVEALRLVTVDRVLAEHPLAWVQGRQ